MDYKSRSKNSNPLVSVIMPVYNAGEYLVEAIKSILDQTYDNFEFLVIDDGSQDNSWEIIKNFRKNDKRIKIFRNTKRLGLVRSLNFLIPRTKGDFIARMDADDISLPDRFDEQIRYLMNNPGIVACGGQEYIIDKDGEVIAEKLFPTDPKVCYDTLMNFMVIQPPLLMARGKIFRKYRYDNHIFKNDDITMHFKLLKSGLFGNVDKVIFKYRKLDKSLTHRDPKKVFFLALKARIHAIRKHGFRPSFKNILIAVVETAVVILVPSKLVVVLFEILRYSRNYPISIFKKVQLTFNQNLR